MFKAELEWLYTGEGMGEMVEWLNDREGRSGLTGGATFGLGLLSETEGEGGRLEGPADVKRERLRNVRISKLRSLRKEDRPGSLTLTSLVLAGPRLHVAIQALLGRQAGPPPFEHQWSHRPGRRGI